MGFEPTTAWTTTRQQIVRISKIAQPHALQDLAEVVATSLIAQAHGNVSALLLVLASCETGFCERAVSCFGGATHVGASNRAASTQ
jgi:hypothetical protein